MVVRIRNGILLMSLGIPIVHWLVASLVGSLGFIMQVPQSLGSLITCFFVDEILWLGHIGRIDDMKDSLKKREDIGDTTQFIGIEM